MKSQASYDELRGDRNKNTKQLNIRISDDFLSKLRDKAKINGRSLNSEILITLRDSCEAHR
jgi:hypothetical protein